MPEELTAEDPVTGEQITLPADVEVGEIIDLQFGAAHGTVDNLADFDVGRERDLFAGQRVFRSDFFWHRTSFSPVSELKPIELII